jgi:hypothetical protein
MKGKKTTFFLLPVVLAIWAVIGWKVYTAVKDNDESNAPAQIITPSKEAVAELPDTIVLLANYRDPFLDKPVVQAPKAKNPAVQKAPAVKAEQPKVSAWPALSYQGLIKRNSDQKMVGFLSVNGASSFVQPGQAAGEIKVMRMWKDSIEVAFGKEKRILRK